MPYFKIVRTEVVEHVLSIYAEDADAALITGSIGPLSFVKDKEAVEYLGSIECAVPTRVVDSKADDYFKGE